MVRECLGLAGVIGAASPAGVPVDVEFDAVGNFLVPSNLPTP